MKRLELEVVGDGLGLEAQNGVDSQNDGTTDDEDELEGNESDEEDRDDGRLVDMQMQPEEGLTFEEAMNAEIDVILDFASGLRHQIQYRDQRMLNSLQREGASFLRFARACIEKERKMNSHRGGTPPTWDKSTSSAMFYCARHAVDKNT